MHYTPYRGCGSETLFSAPAFDFHGMENENPYTHILDFKEVFTTFKEGAFDMDLLKLKAFPLTLKDKA